VATVLFIGLALFIPALCVLPRVLSEKRLLETHLAVLSLTSAATDTLTGMLLLAIILSVSGTGSKLSPLWTILLCIAHFIVLWFIIKRLLEKIGWWVLKKGRIDIKEFFFIFLILFSVSWFTEVIGISASFGAFEVGLLVPRKGPLIRMIQAKLEDFIIGICLPIFFVISGLNTEFYLINDVKSIILTIAIILVGFFSKSISVFISGIILKLSFREALSFGILLSMKGLVALVIFNIALTNKIITVKFFTMLVASVLVSCFITTPLLYLSMKKLKGNQISEPKKTFNTLVIPQNPELGPAIISLVNIFASKQRNELKLIILRILEPSERTSEYTRILRKKALKQDEILGPAYERSNLLFLPCYLKFILSTEISSDLILFSNEEQIDFLIIGFDFTVQSKQLITHLINKLSIPLGIYCGIKDIGLNIQKIIIPFNNPNQLIHSFLSLLIQNITKNNNCDEIILYHFEEINEIQKEVQEKMQTYINLLNSSFNGKGKMILKHNITKNLINALKEEIDNEKKVGLFIMDVSQYPSNQIFQIMEDFQNIEYNFLFLFQNSQKINLSLENNFSSISIKNNQENEDLKDLKGISTCCSSVDP
jgi:Kef-type K+ transport system membrane component KefB